jgi:mRNA interferase MazF
VAEFPREFPRRGEIYWAPTDKRRPVVIVSADVGNKFSSAVVVAAITRTVPEKDYPMNVYLGANDPLPEPGVVMCRSLYTMRKEELDSYRADLRPEQLSEVDGALGSALQLRLA